MLPIAGNELHCVTKGHILNLMCIAPQRVLFAKVFLEYFFICFHRCSMQMCSTPHFIFLFRLSLDQVPFEEWLTLSTVQSSLLHGEVPPCRLCMQRTCCSGPLCSTIGCQEIKMLVLILTLVQPVPDHLLSDCQVGRYLLQPKQQVFVASVSTKQIKFFSARMTRECLAQLSYSANVSQRHKARAHLVLSLQSLFTHKNKYTPEFCWAFSTYVAQQPRVTNYAAVCSQLYTDASPVSYCG